MGGGAGVESVEGGKIRLRSGGLPERAELELEQAEPRFVAPPAPPEHLAKQLHLSQFVTVKRSAHSSVWHGS